MHLPIPKAGDLNALEYVLDKLDIDFDTNSTETKWVAAKRIEGEEELKLRDIPVRKGLVPIVVGMGARDAVYLLESAGLRVSMNGAGRVSSQSVPPGTAVSRVNGISLTLK